MADKIVSPDDYDWNSGPSSKGHTRYRHLLDGNAREIKVKDYGVANVDNLRIALAATARKHGLKSRSKKLDEETLLFQVIGKRDE